MAYDPVAQALHWFIFLLVALQYGTKLVHPGDFGATEAGLDRWHLAIGPTILLVMLVRLFWRLTHRPAPLPDDVPRPIRRLAAATHWGFYAILIVLPVLGWVSASGYGVRPVLLGLIPLPALTGESKSVGEAWGDVHGTLAWVLLALIVLHIGGAMYHAVVRRDGVFGRMLPGPP